MFHVAARSLATQALSIFGDHSDVMAARSTGWGMLSLELGPGSAWTFALIAQAATLEARIPFLHFFDGFRTSHEVAKIELLTDDDMRAMIDDESGLRASCRALSPDHPVMRGTAQNPDVFFQARETVQSLLPGLPRQSCRTRWTSSPASPAGSITCSSIVGAPDAERVIVMMGSGGEAAHETVETCSRTARKSACCKVRLYRPFCRRALSSTRCPQAVKSIAVLDRTKEPGSAGEPLYLDVVTALVRRMGRAADTATG